MQLTSSAFEDGQTIPRRHTEDGHNVSPPLSWQGQPQGTAQLALIVDDPDAPSAQPWVHWVIYSIPPDRAYLPEGLPRQVELQHPVSAQQGRNSWPSGNIGYRGPAPPPGHGTHHYHFKLYALDASLNLEGGIDKATLLSAIEGHILEQTELVGTYSR